MEFREGPALVAVEAKFDRQGGSIRQDPAGLTN